MSQGLARCLSQPAAGTCFCGRRGALLTGRDNVLPLPLLFIFKKDRSQEKLEPIPPLERGTDSEVESLCTLECGETEKE